MEIKVETVVKSKTTNIIKLTGKDILFLLRENGLEIPDDAYIVDSIYIEVNEDNPLHVTWERSTETKT